MNIFDEKKEILSRLIFDGFVQATDCHKILFESIFEENESKKQIKLTCALAYLTEAHTLFTTAEIFTKENANVLDDRQEFNELFHQFSVFNHEVLDNVKTNHSHQWSDIEFKSFVKKFKLAASLLEIENAAYFIDLANN